MSRYATLIASTVMMLLFLPPWLLGFFICIETMINSGFTAGAGGLAFFAIISPVVVIPTAYVVLFFINGRSNRSFSD